MPRFAVWAHFAGEWAGERRETFTPFPTVSFAELFSWELPRVCFLIELVCVVTSELRAPFVPDQDLKVTYV